MALKPQGNWLITGCSSGLGKALALRALQQGHRVMATARDVAGISDLGEIGGDNILLASLDVTRPEALADVLERGRLAFGEIDVLVNNAGHGYIAAIEEGDDDQIRALFDTNFLAPARLIRAILPGMRAQGFGRIVNIGSVAAHAPNAGAGYYAASKAALTTLSRSLALEAEPFGIRVTTFHPGPFPTEFSGRSMKFGPENPEYRDNPAGLRRRSGSASGSSPEQIAALMVDAVWSASPPAELLVGKTAIRRVGAQIAQFGAENAVWEGRSSAIE